MKARKSLAQGFQQALGPKDSLTMSKDSLRRLTIDEEVTLGSLYDLRTDQRIGVLSFPDNLTIKSPSNQPPICLVNNNGSFNEQKMLLEIGIQEEQRLNVILSMVPKRKMLSLIDYSFPKEDNIRFLYYCYFSQREFIQDNRQVTQRSIPKQIPASETTHIVSEINRGFQVFVVLRLVPNNDKAALDKLLDSIRARLISSKFSLENKEKSLLSQVEILDVFSNYDKLISVRDLYKICEVLVNKKNNVRLHPPMAYSCLPIRWFYPDHNSPLERINSIANGLYIRINGAIPKLLSKTPNPNTRMQAIRDAVLTIRQGILSNEEAIRYFNEILQKSPSYSQNLANPLSSLVSREKKPTSNHKQAGSQYASTDNQQIHNISGTIASIKASSLTKEQSPSSLDTTRKGQFRESSDNFIASASNFGENSSQTFHKRTQGSLRIDKNTFDHSNTGIEKQNNQYQKIYPELREEIPDKQSSFEEMRTPEYSSQHENRFENQHNNVTSIMQSNTKDSKHGYNKCANVQTSPPISPSLDIRESNSPAKQHMTSSNEISSPVLTDPNALNEQVDILNDRDASDSVDAPLSDEIEQDRDESPVLNSNYINVLLLGESGVGKSTFINAFVNYLQYDTFEKARSNKPIALIPVSFLMTVGDKFDERIIKFGEVNANEDHDHPGQSVTQNCKSYVFKVDEQAYLRIIDTPGMGDTRGVEQDDENMDNILSFINNLPYLNAICILLKPNTSKLSVVLRSYFIRLLSFLGEHAQHNILFCFTNTRSTFFAPGDTAPLLRKLIANSPNKNIPFTKANTFCFDSESFRYLVALEHGIEFDAEEEVEYQRSWNVSVKEANRLYNYICEELSCYNRVEWQSVEHLQFKIRQMIRPVLETIRNILRNITLLKTKPPKAQIKLVPVLISQTSGICKDCPRNPEQFESVWILPDELHTLTSNKCDRCKCKYSRHIVVDYGLKYELAGKDDQESSDEMISNIKQLKKVLLEFAYFYACTPRNSKQNDYLKDVLDQMIKEENQICSSITRTCANSDVYEVLVVLGRQYESKQKEAQSNSSAINVPMLYEMLLHINAISDIKKQLDIIEKVQENYLVQNESEISYSLK